MPALCWPLIGIATNCMVDWNVFLNVGPWKYARIFFHPSPPVCPSLTSRQPTFYCVMAAFHVSPFSGSSGFLSSCIQPRTVAPPGYPSQEEGSAGGWRVSKKSHSMQPWIQLRVLWERRGWGLSPCLSPLSASLIPEGNSLKCTKDHQKCHSSAGRVPLLYLVSALSPSFTNSIARGLRQDFFQEWEANRGERRCESTIIPILTPRYFPLNGYVPPGAHITSKMSLFQNQNWLGSVGVCLCMPPTEGAAPQAELDWVFGVTHF